MNLKSLILFFIQCIYTLNCCICCIFFVQNKNQEKIELKTNWKFELLLKTNNKKLQYNNQYKLLYLHCSVTSNSRLYLA